MSIQVVSDGLHLKGQSRRQRSSSNDGYSDIQGVQNPMTRFINREVAELDTEGVGGIENVLKIEKYRKRNFSFDLHSSHQSIAHLHYSHHTQHFHPLLELII